MHSSTDCTGMMVRECEQSAGPRGEGLGRSGCARQASQCDDRYDGGFSSR